MLLGHLEQQLLMLRSVKRRTTTAAGGSLHQQPWLRVGVEEFETLRVLVLKKGNERSESFSKCAKGAFLRPRAAAVASDDSHAGRQLGDGEPRFPPPHPPPTPPPMMRSAWRRRLDDWRHINAQRDSGGRMTRCR